LHRNVEVLLTYYRTGIAPDAVEADGICLVTLYATIIKLNASLASVTGAHATQVLGTFRPVKRMKHDAIDRLISLSLLALSRCHELTIKDIAEQVWTRTRLRAWERNQKVTNRQH